MINESDIYPQQWIAPVEEIQPGSTVVLYARVSDPSQKENLPAQKQALESEAKDRKFRVVRKISEIASGKRGGRRGFQAAIETAKIHGAAVLARDLNRFRRSRSIQHDARLTAVELESLRREADGVQLATIVPPDAPEEEVRSHQIKIGQAATGRYGGRPVEEFPKKARRLKMKPKASRLWWQGMSVGQIARELGCPRSTVRDWLYPIKNHPPNSSFGRR